MEFSPFWLTRITFSNMNPFTGADMFLVQNLVMLAAGAGLRLVLRKKLPARIWGAILVLGWAVPEIIADFAARTQITYNEGLQAPIDEGQIVGTLTYTAPDGTVITGMLSAERAMQARPEHASIYDVLPFLLPLEPFFSSGFAWVALALALLVIFILLIHRARKKAATNRRRAAVYRAKRRAYDHAEAERRRAEAQRRLTERQRRQRANAQQRPAPRPQGQQRPQSAPRKRPGPRDGGRRY